MSRTLVMVWLGAATLRPVHAPDLASWAESRGVTLKAPAAEAPLPSGAHDEELSARIEALLADARTAGYSADLGAADKALSSAELLLRGNPELPEAPWLMAETCAEHATLVRASDPALANILERRARLLGGTRAHAFNETVTAPAEAALPPSSLDGPLPDDSVYVDGMRVQTGTVLEAGEHLVRVERHGRLAWAGWVTAEGAPVRIAVPGVEPCTQSDLERVHVVGNDVKVDEAVMCPEWMLARDAGPARIDVSMCRNGRCGPFLPWSRNWGEVFEGRPQALEHREKTNKVLLWTGIGLGAVLTGAFVAWQAGAFDHDGPPRTTIRFSGPGER